MFNDHALIAHGLRKNSEVIDSNAVRKVSCWRVWKQLSRLQRTVLYCGLFMSFCFIVLYTLSPSLNKTSSSTDKTKLVFPAQKRISQKFQTKKVYNEIKFQINQTNHVDNVKLNISTLEVTAKNDIYRGYRFVGPSNARQTAVVAALKHAWRGYKKFAWGFDHLKPISRKSHNWFGLGLTLIDSLDTLFIMNLSAEFEEARLWVENDFNLDINKDVNLFETTIRVLGGLLSAYHLSNQSGFLKRAEDLGRRLMGGFKTTSGIPYSDVNLRTGQGRSPGWVSDSSTSEVTTLQMEFRDLSRCLGESGPFSFEDVSFRVSKLIHRLPKENGLVPIFISTNPGRFRRKATLSLGARGDSYYEYLLKQWIQTGKTIDFLRDDYLEAIISINNTLRKRSIRNGYTFIGELNDKRNFIGKMDELVCFLPGTLALGVMHGLAKWHLNLALDLMLTCYLMYAQQPTHLAPEISYFLWNFTQAISQNDMTVKSGDTHYLLRPETIESLWYLYYITGNKTFQDWGWNIFQGIEKFAKVENGYTTLGDVTNVAKTRPKNMMESFFLSETLKYLYLLFSNDNSEIDLHKWILNTEAHLLPIRKF